MSKSDAALNELRALCSELPGAEEYVMVHHPAFRVGKKPFLIAGMNENDQGATVSINLGAEAQDALLEDARFTRTPYIGRHGWVTVTQADVAAGELSELVVDSYRRIATRKHLTELDATKAPSRKKKATSRAVERRGR